MSFDVTLDYREHACACHSISGSTTAFRNRPMFQLKFYWPNECDFPFPGAMISREMSVPPNLRNAGIHWIEIRNARILNFALRIESVPSTRCYNVIIDVNAVKWGGAVTGSGEAGGGIKR